MSDMIERVTKALDKAAVEWCNRPPYDKPKELFTRYLANAAIGAMLEGDQSESDCSHHFRPGRVRPMRKDKP